MILSSIKAISHYRDALMQIWQYAQERKECSVYLETIEKMALRALHEKKYNKPLHADTKPPCDHEWVGLYGHPAAFECKKCKALSR